MEQNFSLKDQLFNQEKVQKIALEIKDVYGEFDDEAFIKESVDKFPSLELKKRIYHIRDMLKKHLPHDYKVALKILLDSLPEELDKNRSDDDFGDFIYAPYSEFVASYGCFDEYLEFSLEALKEITKRFSVEFAIRDFINSYPKETLSMLMQCSLSHNYHQRRLASEALRPKLPWAKKLTISHHEALPILENLFYDKTRFVTRSVANHLNDISKIEPSLVVSTLKQYKASKKQNDKEMSYMIKHSLRTLIKSGHKEALEFLGYERNPDIKVGKITFESKTVFIGEALVFEFEIKANQDVKLLIDYIVHFKTKSGKTSPKVHKLKELNIKKDQSITIQKRHPFKANMTTRKLYTGEHKIELQINGAVQKDATFMLKNLS